MVVYKPTLLLFAGLVVLTTIVSFVNCAPRPYRGSSWDGDAGWDLGGRMLEDPAWGHGPVRRPFPVRPRPPIYGDPYWGTRGRSLYPRPPRGSPWDDSAWGKGYRGRSMLDDPAWGKGYRRPRGTWWD